MKKEDLPLSDLEIKLLIMFSNQNNLAGNAMTKFIVQHGLLRNVAEKLKKDVERVSKLPEAQPEHIQQTLKDMINKLSELLNLTKIFDEEDLLKKQSKYN